MTAATISRLSQIYNTFLSITCWWAYVWFTVSNSEFQKTTTESLRLNAAADINSTLDLLLLGHVHKAHLA